MPNYCYLCGNYPAYIYGNVMFLCSKCILAEQMSTTLERNKMETLAKSRIMSKVKYAIDRSENFDGEWILKNTGELIRISITIKPQEYYVDEKGVKWVRA